MPLHLDTQADLEEAIHALLKLDPRLRPVFEIAGMPALRRRSRALRASRNRLRPAGFHRERRGDLGPRQRGFDRSIMSRSERRGPTAWAGSACPPPR